MPTRYRVRGPDNKEWDVNAPDGATREQAIEFIQREHYPQWSAEQAAAPKTTASGIAGGFTREAAPMLAGAAIGGTLGAMTGPAAPILAPAGAIAGMATLPLADMASAGARKLVGGQWQLPSEVLNQWMTKAGVAEPDTAIERMAGGAGAGIGGFAASVPAAARLAVTAASPVTRGVMRMLAANPEAQAVAQPAGGATGTAVTDITGNPVAGFAAGMGAGSIAAPLTAGLVRRGITPFPSRLPGDQQRLAGIARQEGIPMTIGQETGSPTARNFGAVLANLPFSGEMMADTADAQRMAFNRSVLSRAGVQAERADPQTLSRAFDSWGAERDATLQQVPVMFTDRQAINTMATVGQNVEQNGRAVFDRKWANVQQLLQQPSIEPARLAAVRSDIGATARGTADQNLRSGLRDLQAVLDDLVERQAPQAVADDLRDQRRRYQALMTVDDAMGGGTQADRSTGNIPFGSFRGAVDRSDPYGYARGRGQYNDLARVGDFLGSSAIPNSGTPQRLFIQGLVTGSGAAGGVASAAQNMMHSTPVTALAAALSAAASLGAPPVLAGAARNPYVRGYLTNQRLPAPAFNFTNRRMIEALAGALGATRAQTMLPAPQD